MIPTQQLGQLGRTLVVAGSALNPAASNVMFQLHGDELPWIDMGYTGHGIANYGAVVDTSIKPSFATGSIGPNGLDTTGIRAASGATNNDFKFGTGSWFMEAQVYTNNNARIFDTRSAPGSNGWVFGVGASRKLYFQDDGVAYETAVDQITLSAWQHVAASYDGTSLRLFIAGALVLTTVVALNIDTGQHLAILNTNDVGPGAPNGYTGSRLAELRIVKGQSVVTAAFTAPTARMSDAGAGRALQTNVTYSNVVLRSTYDSNVNDVSNAARTMTAAGNAVVSSAQSKFGGSSLLLDGTGDYVSAADSADFDMGTGDYQFQAWVRRNGTHSDPVVFSCYTSSTVGYSLALATTTYIPYFNETGDGVDGVFLDTCANTTWAHVAVGRKDAVLYTFVDGLLQRFASSTQTVNCAGTMFVGRLSAAITTLDWLGNIDDMQLVKGECQLYRSFLVPTAALPVS